MKTLYLDIGRGKTGTSYLQSALRSSESLIYISQRHLLKFLRSIEHALGRRNHVVS